MNGSYFNNKTVWITGASSGIGEALAYEFSRHGARPVLSAIDDAALAAVAGHCREAGAPATFTEAFDIGDHDRLPEIASRVLDRTGGIDILVNNAGIGQRASALDCGNETVRRITDVNFLGPVFLTGSVLPSMIARVSGRIVVIASVLGRYHLPGRSAYAASKHALIGYFSTLRTELRNSGVAVSIIMPGWITTNMSLNALTADGSTYNRTTRPPSRRMSAGTCARQIIKALAAGKTEVSIGGIETWGGILRLLFPRFFDRLISRRQGEFIFHRRHDA